MPMCVCILLPPISRLHTLGVLHRDVKLENLLCDTSKQPPRVKLCDFGHAISYSNLDHDRQFFGTPGYAAPEVTQGAPVWSPLADVWAMGVVMYALLANSLPFETDGDALRRPADLSSKVWWRVSVEAKLLLQALLEVQVNARGSLETCEHSAWFSLELGAVRDAPMRQAYSSADMAQLQRAADTAAEARRLAMAHSASWNCLEAADAHAACSFKSVSSSKDAVECDSLMAELRQAAEEEEALHRTCDALPSLPNSPQLAATVGLPYVHTTASTADILAAEVVAAPVDDYQQRMPPDQQFQQQRARPGQTPHTVPGALSDQRERLERVRANMQLGKPATMAPHCGMSID